MELRRKRAPSPPKPSRLQPSEPLHMTTRAASKAGSNASESRRGSFVSIGQISPTKDDESERYPKRRRVSTASKTTPTRASQSSQALSTASRPSTRSMSGGNLPRIDETPTMIKKRKRSSDQSGESLYVASALSTMKTESLGSTTQSPEAKKPPQRKAKRSSTSSREDAPKTKKNLRSSDVSADQAQLNLNKANEFHEHEAEVAEARVGLDEPQSIEDARNGEFDGSVDASELHQDDTQASGDTSFRSEDQQSPSKRNRPSNASFAASDALELADGANDSFNDVSMEQDDDAEEDNDEENEEEEADADVDGEMPEDVTTSLEIVPLTCDPTPAGSAQASPAGSPPDSSMDQDSPVKRTVTSIPIGDMGLTEDGTTTKGKKKLPGRRRAPHANPKVEAALRRQLHLRMNYRAVAKALKPILAELGQRSLSSLESDPKAHEESSEYAGVKEGLHQHFEKRLAWVQKHKELNKKRLKDQLEAEMEMRRSQFNNVARNIQEMHIIRLEHDFLTAVRDHEQKIDGYASDDENEDVIPPLRHATATGKVTNILGPEYHWRSRPAIETDRLFEELFQRHEVVRDRRDHSEKPDFDESHPFTTFDPTIRDDTQTTKRVDYLIQALKETQELPLPPPPPPPILNSEAVGLQALANASIASAAIDAAVRFAEERAEAQEEAFAKAKKEEELSRPSPLSVPKPSMSQPPEESYLQNHPTNPPTSVPTPVQTPRTDHVRLVEPSRPEQSLQQPAQQIQSRLQPQPASRPATTFSQVALGPSITGTAPMAFTQGPTYQYPPPHPIIPGLHLLDPSVPVQIPGLGSLPSILNHQKPPTPKPLVHDPPTSSHVSSGQPLHRYAPEPISNEAIRQDEARQTEQGVLKKSREASVSHSRTPSVPSAQPKSTGKDFWSSLARGATENGTSKVKLAPKESPQYSMSDAASKSRGEISTPSHPLDSHPLERNQLGPPLGHSDSHNHPLDRAVGRSQEHHQDWSQDRSQDHRQERPQERHQDRPLEQHPLGGGNNQDKASSRLPSIASATGSDPHSQRPLSTNEVLGPLLDRLNAPPEPNSKPESFANKSQKKRAPKQSLYGPWPRSRNYDPFKNEQNRRASLTRAPEGPPAMHARPIGGYGTPDHRPDHQHPPPFSTPNQSHPPPPFPILAPPQGAYPPPPQYAPVPSPYGYDQHQSPYQQSPYQQPPYRAPTGFSSLPGPPPMSQPPPQGAYYPGPQPPYPPPLAARPPASQAQYGPQYGGQPILPANPGPGGYGQNGSVHGSPPAGHAGPAFAQYHRDEGRRNDYGRGGRGRHSGGHEWKHYQGPHR